MLSQLNMASSRCPTAPVRHGRAAPLHRTAPTTATRARAGARRRRFSHDYDFQPSDQVEEVVEEASASSNGFFNESFKSVLSSTLERQGTASLLQGQEKMVDEHNLTDQEDVLKAAIMAAKSTLLKLNLVKKEVDQAIEIETKQVERLMFALNKARNDAAYYRGLGKMMEDGLSD